MRYWFFGALVIAAVGAGRSQPERPYATPARPYEIAARPDETPQPPPLHVQLDRYFSGDFDAVTSGLLAGTDFGNLLDDLKKHGPGWIDAKGPGDRPRRALAAATFALETARAAENEDWKWIQRLRDLNPPQPPSVWWKAPPQMIEWACAVARDGGLPPDVERTWHLAAVAVAQRRSDYQFLLGSLEEFGGATMELTHLPHVTSRFPDEPRFALAQAIALEWRTWPLTAQHARTATPNLAGAMRAFDRPQLLNDTAVGAEATVRLGALRLRGRNLGGALDLFERAETLTRDRYLIYLARFFSGQARERQNRPADAERAYRGALATIPKAISATMALAVVLTKAGRVSEASELVEAALTASPPPVDPWRTYAAADDRFWPELLGRLREAIRSGGGAQPGRAQPARPYLHRDDTQDNGDEADPGGGAELAPPYGDQQQQPVFRGRTDLVTIDVSVRSQGTPVAGLTPKDFVLKDNGVPQTVEQIEMEAVPVDVSILVDMNEDLADDMKGMAAEIPRIVALLRPDDRVRVTAINTYVTDLIHAQKAATVPPLGRLTPRGLSSAHDGLASALLRRVEPNRRHLVIALTNGIDAISALDALSVRDIARYSNATLYIAQVDIALLDPLGVSGRQRADSHRCRASGICAPTKRFWQPFGDYEFEVLAGAAELTGGKLYLPGIFTDRTAAAIFKKVFEDYRRSYLLRYVPAKPTPGWHEVTVTIPGYPSYEVQARRGYLVEGSGAAKPAAPYEGTTGAAKPAAPFAPIGIADLAGAYGRGDFQAFVSGLRRVTNPGDLFRELRELGNPWPDQPKRESAFVLELADFALQSPRRVDREPAQLLLTGHAALVRGPLWPGPYEKYWLWAAALVLEGANQPATTVQFLDEALKRFPKEPRFLLGRAFALDQRRALDPLSRNGVLLPVMSAHVTEVAAAYDAAMPFPETAAEARIRKGWLLFRAGRRDDALALFDAVGPLQDAFLDYIRQLMRGHVLGALGRIDEARGAYLAALEQFPTAQSARVALMATLQRLGDRSGATGLAEAIQMASPDALDPWWLYWQGDYRVLVTVFTRLREEAR